ncbi:hypothetical protein X798_06083 [Onchocerca flexuosa]|uniref:DUF4806 domain-containing protein n=2 Tax=Onchocerca flexuosa TaxID=387005 RepID=A0A183HAU2_9BILA|nr:hypothetical protein X798_06083 [Onchocerca flexuosa]VDO40466.1 unnamed protein product [Onchocerca flexuosa]
MVEHLKDTVNCVASGKEQHITTTEIYEMLQTKNKQSRWENAFQFPPVLRNLSNRSHYLKTNLDEKAEISAWIKMDCAETAIKLKKYIATFEENSMKMIGAAVLRKKRLHQRNFTKNILIDVRIAFMEVSSVERQFTDQSASSKNIQRQGFVTVNNDQCYSQSWLSSISPNSSMETSITIQD